MENCLLLLAGVGCKKKEAVVLLRATEAAPRTAGLTAIDAAEVVARPKPNLANISSLIYYCVTCVFEAVFIY